ncbi:MAG: hypothetical protein JXQ73_27200 [Phycisphaerae bacterium]|nr:hypothetical protein [Phycisphaerae bacterium]
MRMCDLGVGIEDTKLEPRIDKLYEELKQRAVRFKPHFWISSEWFTPDGVPGCAIPFYLAHPRLMRLEESQMLEVEGGTSAWFMRLLRHETGHAVANAYQLYRRPRWQRHFGKASRPYPEYYQPRPYSKRFVLHLDYWYAQSHPTEDFAETFAVWLTPGSSWHKHYAGWPALEKLECVDALMRDVAKSKPAVSSRRRVDPIRSIRTTLREHYEEKRARYGTDFPDFYDRDLRRVFDETVPRDRREPAAKFLRRIRPQVRPLLARWTGEHQYTINIALSEMIGRCRQLDLKVGTSEDQAKLEAVVMLTIQVMNYLHSGRHRLAL